MKGDALAGILIIFVNFLGGIAMGILRHGQTFDDALETYTLLTVGDGLVAQIPALLISIGTGFIITRVNADDENLGVTMIRQIGNKGEVLLTAAALSLAAGFLPGFPLAVFLLIAIGLMIAAVWRFGGPHEVMQSIRAARGKALPSGAPGAAEGADSPSRSATAQPGGMANVIPETIALAMLVPTGQLAWTKQHNLAGLLEQETFIRLGLKIPLVDIREREGLEENRLYVLVNEIQAGVIRVAPGQHKVVTGADMLVAGGTPLTDLSDANDASYWVDETLAKQEWQSAAPAFFTHSDTEEVAERFTTIVARRVSELFGIQETKDLLDQLESKYPELVKEAIRNAPMQRISNVLQRLAAERISIRNLKMILEAIAQWAPRERDNILLVEHVRSALGRYITEKFSRNQRLNVLVLSPKNEERLRRGVQQTANGTFLNLAPGDADVLLQDLAVRLADLYLTLEDVVVLASSDIRRFVKHVIESQYPQLDVISYSEITGQSRINVLHTI